MRQPFPTLSAAALACALCSASLAASGQSAPDRTSDKAVAPAVAHKQAREIAKGDPARWYRADKTHAARMRTLKKEIAAAYTEARTACYKRAPASRASCLKSARNTWQHDSANAPAILAAAPAAESFTERVSTMGTSEGGATGSGAGAAPQSGQGQQGQNQSGQNQSGQMQSGQSQSGQTQSGTPVEDTSRPTPVQGQTGPVIDDTVPPERQPRQEQP
jgi:hypothetical protein